MRAAVETIEREAGRGRRARQQRRLRAGGSLRVHAHGRGAPPVRDQRLRPDPAEPALPAGHAAAALGQDRQPELHGRQAHVSRRRLLPRDEARRGGAQRRAAIRGAGLRGRRDRRRARSHQDALRRHGGRQRRPRRRRPGLRGLQPGGRGEDQGSLRGPDGPARRGTRRRRPRHQEGDRASSGRRRGTR